MHLKELSSILDTLTQAELEKYMQLLRDQIKDLDYKLMKERYKDKRAELATLRESKQSLHKDLFIRFRERKKLTGEVPAKYMGN